MSPADLAPYVTAVIAVIGTLLGGVVAGMFGLLQMRGTRRAQKQDTWIKAYDEQRRLIWAERKVAYAQLLNHAEKINMVVHRFELIGQPSPDQEDYEARNNAYTTARSAFDDASSAAQDSYWKIFTFGQLPVSDAAMRLSKLQANAYEAIREQRPVDVQVLYKSFSQLVVAMRKGLTDIPEPMREGLRGTGIDSLYEIG